MLSPNASAPPTPKLSIVIVSWNVRALLQRAIRSIKRSWKENGELEIIVVDNHSNDGTVAMVETQFPDVRLIANPYNAGFTRGNNQGIRASRGELILLLNPDTEIKDKALQKMVNYLEIHPDVGLVGPQLLNPDGTRQSSRRRFPTIPVLFLESTWLQSLAPKRMLARYYVKERSAQETQLVDWVTGAAMMTRRRVVNSVGHLDERFFMYSEELDWCRRIKDAGWDIVYLPEAAIVHHEGKSSEQVVPARHIYFQSSKIHYAEKYHGRWLGLVLRGWIVAQYLWQTVVERLKWLVGHRRALRASRIRAYWLVIRSGLNQKGPINDDATN
jgi:hypothetical protein